MIMKCSLKDIFINILVSTLEDENSIKQKHFSVLEMKFFYFQFFIIIIIIIITPSEGVDFPLFLPRGSVISKSMNLQQLRASINKLQDLDSFPVSSENQLHKIVKKQMTDCDYHKRKNKRSIAAIPERLKSFDVMNKGDGYTKSLQKRPEILKSRDSLSFPAYGMCLSKLAQMARNSGIRFYPSDRLKNDEIAESIEKQDPSEPEEETPVKIETPYLEEKLDILKEDDLPDKDKNTDTLTQEVLDNIKAIMNSDVYAKANENKIKDIAKMMRDDEYQQVEDLNLQWPCMNVEDKIKEYLSEDQLPEIKLQAGETEDKIKENESKNKLFKGPDEKVEGKEIKEKKDPGSEEKNKLQEPKNEKAGAKNLEDVKTWENMSEKEMAKVEKEEAEKKKKEEEELQQNNPNLKSKLRRIPDENDFRYYYECEAKPNGCLKLRHKRCPQGQFFSFKFLKCLKAENKQENNKMTKNKSILKRHTSFDSFSGNAEPANEWLDASQDSTTVVPSEFQSTTEPGLKIYHLRQKRKFKEMTAKEMAENVEPDIGYRPKILNEAPKNTENPEVPFDGIFRKHRKHHTPRSYVIRIKKKEGKDQITENNENEIDNDEDDQDSEDDDEDEEVEDEEEEENDDEDISEDTTTKTEGSGQGLRDLFRAAKTAVTNRARFEDPTLAIAMNAGNRMNQNASKKEPADSDNQNKKVLIDANIKVDSTIGSVLKSLMKSKRKESLSSLTGDEESLISDRGSQDQLDPELLRMYEHLMRSNPRVKRYFLANRYKKGK